MIFFMGTNTPVKKAKWVMTRLARRRVIREFLPLARYGQNALMEDVLRHNPTEGDSKNDDGHSEVVQ